MKNGCQMTLLRRGTAPAVRSFGLLVLSAAPVLALPPDPQRPFTALTCDAALVRLAEAKAGNPLISAAEMAQVVIQAHAQAQRLCAATPERLTDQDISIPSQPKRE